MDLDPVDFEDFKNFKKSGFREIDAEFLKKAKVSWLTRVLLEVSLSWGMRRLAKELGMSDALMSKKAHALFGKVERVDIVPSRSNTRGFEIILDNALSLFFYQDGDHFVYDGFEMGPYEDGDVTIFDKLWD